jgi:two-component system, cell cycle sensor histidine kinase and response regulator CckA
MDATSDSGTQKTTVMGGSVLVMDDEKMIRDLMSELLKSMGYQVEQAQNGHEAIELYRRAKQAGTPHDLVIMDLTIPGGMGGKEAIAELLAISPDIKAVVSSGYSNDPIMADYKKYGFFGVLKKPFKITDLKNILVAIKESGAATKFL